MNEETLFQLALEKPPQDRVAFLESACGADAELRFRVERLLLAHDNPGSFLQQPALHSTGKPPDEVTQALDTARAS